MVNISSGNAQGCVNITTNTTSGNISAQSPSPILNVQTQNNLAEYWSEKSHLYANNSSQCATNSYIWAEGTDAQVQTLGGVHSAKTWASNTEGANKDLSNLSATGEAKFDNKQNKLTAGAGIDIVNNIISSTLTGIPVQTDQNGKFLTTDGTSASWGMVEVLPVQTGQNGKFLTTDGTNASWGTVEVLPVQTGQNGKFLTTDGTNASWEDIDLSSKLDITSPQAQAPYLKTTYINGTSGYNIWSNGYCEQWGRTNLNVSSQTIILIKTYSNTYFNVTSSYGSLNSHSSGGSDAPMITIDSNNQIYVDMRSGTNRLTFWKTSGYLAEGEY